MVFRAGGCLGYALRDNPSLLGKLLGATPEQAIGYVERLEASAQARSEWATMGERTLNYVYTVLEFGTAGILGEGVVNQKESGKKCDEEFAQLVIILAFTNGAAYGFYFADEFAACWRGSDQSQTPEEWAEARELGIVEGEQPEPELTTLDFGISMSAVEVVKWVQSAAPDYLTEDELAIIHTLVEASGHFEVTD